MERVATIARQLTAGAMAGSPVTTHVLDTATGRPAAGLSLRVSRRKGEGEAATWEQVAEHTTNEDGRVSGLLAGPIAAGEVYEIHFETQAYFSARGDKCFYPYVKIVFEIEDPSSHYHVPLLVAPYGYSTYRGS